MPILVIQSLSFAVLPEPTFLATSSTTSGVNFFHLLLSVLAAHAVALLNFVNAQCFTTQLLPCHPTLTADVSTAIALLEVPAKTRVLEFSIVGEVEYRLILSRCASLLEQFSEEQALC